MSVHQPPLEKLDDAGNDTPTTNQLLASITPIPYASATQHDFLRCVGNLSVSTDALAYWLHQDRIYASQAYPRFIGALISKILFSSASNSRAMNERILKVLVFSLQNVIREVNFFDEIAVKFNLPLEQWKERRGTRDYAAEMARIAGPGGSLAEGMVFLWAMEKIYFDSWSFSKTTHQQLHSGAASELQENQKAINLGAALELLLDNWTCAEFVEFVEELAAIVNLMDIPLQAAENVWGRAIELEATFWPEKEEELKQESKYTH